MGTTWTAADLNASGFGVAAAATTTHVGPAQSAKIDLIQIEVFYTVPCT